VSTRKKVVASRKAVASKKGCCQANIGCTNVSRGNGRGGLLRIVKEKKTAAEAGKEFASRRYQI
jgi:hypothetical protein